MTSKPPRRRQKTVDVQGLATLHGGRERLAQRPSLDDLTRGDPGAADRVETVMTILVRKARELVEGG
jgi:hypothetical protein